MGARSPEKHVRRFFRPPLKSQIMKMTRRNIMGAPLQTEGVSRQRPIIFSAVYDVTNAIFRSRGCYNQYHIMLLK